MTLPSREDFYRLGSSLLRPDAAREREAREVVGRTRSAREAWERLSARGLIPDRWVDDEGMRHVAEPFRQTEDGFGHGRAAKPAPSPSCVEAAVTLASDAEGVEAAGQFGKEWYWRMRHTFISRWYDALRGTLLETSWYWRMRHTFISRPFAGCLWRVLPVTSPLWVRHVSSLGPSLLVSSVGSALRACGADDRMAWAIPEEEGLPQRVVSAMRDVRASVRAAAEGFNGAHGDGAQVWGEASWSAWRWYQLAPEPRTSLRFPAPIIGVVTNVIAGAVMFDRAAGMGGRVLGSVGGVGNPFFGRALLDGHVSAEDDLSSIDNPYAPILDVFARGYVPGGFHTDSSGTWVVLMAAALDPAKMPNASYGRRA